MKYQSHSDTSFAAAEDIENDAATLRGKVYRVIKARKGATDEEIQIVTGMNPSTQRPRRVELVEAGLIGDYGTRRNTTSGRKAVVWELRKP